MNNNFTLNKTEGFSLIPFLIFMLLCTGIIATSLHLAKATTRTTFATHLRSDRYYDAEGGVNRVLSWARTNSQNILTPFKKSNFYNRFDRTTPSIGDNDTGDNPVPTKLKLKGTNNSAILTNNAALATAAFPTTSNIVTNSSFAASTEFESANFGDASVRLTLIDAQPLDPTKDSPPLASPDTDYYPIYRIDGMTNENSGSHVYGYITGNLFYIDIIGFYGKDFVDVRQDCSSAQFTGSAPGPTNAKCPVGSDHNISIHNTAKIYGSARANGTVSPTSKVCADYPSCTNPGTICQGTSCNLPVLPTFGTWSSYCSPLGPDYTVAANQNKILVTPGCYNNVTINNKGSLTLQTTTQPYFFNTLTILGGNAQTQIRVAPNPADQTVQLYVNTITGETLNGNQTINPSYKPSQFRIYYLGAADLTLNGNAPLSFALVSPYANVTLQGSSTFSGGIVAKGLTLTGSATVLYDETLGGTSLSDVTFRLRQIGERYK